MIENISVWAKSIAFAVIVVSILEMFLPNNKTKKYIKMVMGLFIIYNIISPFIKNKDKINFENIDIKDCISQGDINTIEINQESMDKRLQELYKEELEKDITKKVENKGYIVKLCQASFEINKSSPTSIKKITLKIQKDENTEGKLVNEIQKIKKINTNFSKRDDNSEDTKLSDSDKKSLKEFLIKEYEVDEKCLEIN